MPINPNIPLSVRPADIQMPNVLAQAAQLAQLRNYDIQAQEAQAALEERNKLRALDPTAADYESQLFRVNPQLGISYRKERTAAEASEATRQKSLTEAASAKQKMMGQAMRDISSRPSDANITAHMEDVLDSPLYSAQEKAAVQKRSQMLLEMPFEERKLFLSQQGATAGDLRPHMTPQNLGGTTRVLQTPAFGGAATVVPGSEAKRTPTPGELLVDQRARDRLAAESESGNYSPETINYLASIYNQTGQLPALGIGKKAGDVKMRILDEARRLGTQTPVAAPGEAPGVAPTPQEAAEKVVQNKQSRAAEQSTLRSFGAGVEGRSVRSFNTAIDHLDTMSKLATALENGDVRAFNTVANAFAKGVGTAAPTNFDTAKSIVGGEVAKALAGSSMALKDREEIRDAISRANSPEQLAGSVRTLQELMGGQLKSLKLQYESGTNRKDFDSRLSGRAKEVVKSLEGGEPAAAAPAAAGAASVVLPDGRTMNFPNAAAAAAFKKAAGL